MKHILVLSYYFSPDLSAGSFRNTAFVAALSKQVEGKATIHIITTQPNRYHSFRDKALACETYDNITLNRIEVPQHKSGFRDQIQSYLVFYRNALKLVKGKQYDLVYASSSRLFTAYLGKVIARKNNATLYLDIRDIFVETMTDVLKNFAFLKPVVLKAIELLVEHPTFKRAKHINLVSEGFKPYFESYKQATFTYYPNGIDDVFLGVHQYPQLSQEPIIITYAGNIGEGQGLEKIVPQMAQLLGNKYLIKVIGDGGTRSLLEQKLKELDIKNVQIINPVKRDELIEQYRNSHFLFLHLNNYKAFERVLPSKIFEYAATNIPMIAGVNGYSRFFIRKYVTNSFVFDPCDSQTIVNWLNQYSYQLEERKNFISSFNRKKICSDMAISVDSYL